MTAELGSILGAIAVVLIAVVEWAGPRWTKEGRLLARIRRLGEAHALLPESGERARLAVAMTDLARELNAWNTTDQRTVRRWRIGSTIGSLLAAYAVVLSVWSTTALELSGAWVMSLIVGTIAGGLAVLVTEIAERVIAGRTAVHNRDARERAFREGKSLESN